MATPAEPTNDRLWYRDATSLLDELKRGDFTTGPAPEIPGYEDLEEIERGGQGVVYSALQISTRRRVAIKVLYEDASSHPSRRRRFEREVELISSLEHPGIVRVYDSGATPDGRLFFIMEHVEGRSLLDYIEAETPSLSVRLRMFVEICLAVHHAHQHGVIHRDLKPSNILIDGSANPRVVDFGVAKHVVPSADEGAEELGTLTGQFLGTLAYASPEQLRADPSRVDLRTDVYSLGVMLYQLLCDRYPYEQDVPMAERIEAISNQIPVPPGQHVDDVNHELDTIALKSLSKDPDRRYATALALAEDVERYLEGRPIEAKRDSTWYVITKTVKRHKLTSTLAVSMLLLLVVFSVFMTLQYRVASTAAYKAQQIQVFLEDTLSSVQPVALGEDVTLRSVLEDSIHWVEMALQDQPEIEASLRTTIGNSFRQLGLHAEAGEQLDRAHALRERLFGDDHPEVARSLNALALLRMEEGQLDAAEEYFERALEIRRREYGEGSFPVTSSLHNLARLEMRRRHWDTAEAHMQRALSIRLTRRSEHHPDVAMCHFRLAEIAEGRGDATRATSLHGQALSARRKSLPDEHPDVQRSLVASGRLHLAAGDASAARHLFEECYEIQKRTLPPEHWSLLHTRLLLLEAQRSVGSSDDDAIRALVQKLEPHAHDLPLELRTTLRALSELRADPANPYRRILDRAAVPR